jgi:dephospho-CoA kinase
MEYNLVIGLTGGIGSGKTLASDHFASLGVDIIDTDVIARQVVEPGSKVLKQLASEFGAGVLNTDGSLNRAALRKLAFANEENKSKLDDITHPAIREETARQIQSSRSDYCIVVVPLLSEDSPFLSVMQRVIVVTADRETKIERVKVRSSLSASEVERIMQSQLSDEQRLEFADDVIENNSSIEYVHKEVEILHSQYLELSKQA